MCGIVGILGTSDVAQRLFEGPQLVWDYFGPLLEVDPPVAPGDYEVVLEALRENGEGRA